MLGKLSCNVRDIYPTIHVVSSNHWERFGIWLRQQRRLADLTQKNLAEKAGIHEVQLARIEKGESGTRRETVLALAKALNVDTDEALALAGFVHAKSIILDTSEDYDTRVTITRTKPRDFPELVKALGELGIEIDFASIDRDFSNFTPDDFEELKDQIAADVGVKIKRITSR